MCIKVIASQRWDVFWDTVYMFNRRFGLWHHAPSAFSSEAGTLVLGATGTGGGCAHQSLYQMSVEGRAVYLSLRVCTDGERRARCEVRGGSLVVDGQRGADERCDGAGGGVEPTTHASVCRSHWVLLADSVHQPPLCSTRLSLSRRLIHRTDSVTMLCVDVLLCASVDCVISTGIPNAVGPTSFTDWNTSTHMSCINLCSTVSFTNVRCFWKSFLALMIWYSLSQFLAFTALCQSLVLYISVYFIDRDCECFYAVGVVSKARCTSV